MSNEDKYNMKIIDNAFFFKCIINVYVKIQKNDLKYIKLSFKFNIQTKM